MHSARALSPPCHIAIIMDGNGRWAAQRGLQRYEGHRIGASNVREIVRAIATQGIEWLTLYGFSSENWNRPPSEVGFLMQLIKRFIESELAELHSEGIRFRAIGGRDGLEEDIVRLIETAEQLTADNTRMYLQIALNYGAREELAMAARRLAHRVAAHTLDPNAIDSLMLQSELLTAGTPDPDLVIRTGAEKRLSNFLLFQNAYAELYFSDKLWPDFTADDLIMAIEDYMSRERRFGAISQNAQKEHR